MLEFQQPSVSIIERLNLSNEEIQQIEQTILYNVYRAYIKRTSDEEPVDFTATTDEVMFQFSGKQLVGAAYLLGIHEQQIEDGNTTDLMNNLMLTSFSMFRTYAVTQEQFYEVVMTLAAHEQFSLAGESL